MVLSQASGNGWLACVPEPHNYSFCINVSSMQNWEPLMVIEMTPNAPALKVIYPKSYKHLTYVLAHAVKWEIMDWIVSYSLYLSIPLGKNAF